jgi:hypothetical protein
MYSEDFYFVVGSVALHFTVPSAPPAAGHIWILPMNQYAWQLITSGMRCWKCRPSTCRHSSHRQKRFFLIYPLKLICRNLQFPHECFLLILILFRGYCCKLCPSNSQEEKIKRIKIRWTCWPNITADNSVTKDIGQSLLRYTCSVGSSWVFLKPVIESFFFC